MAFPEEEDMKLTLKTYASLRKYTKGETTQVVKLPPGSKIADLLERTQIPADEIKNIMVNGKRSKQDKVLKDGDRVAIFPPIAGG
jgi:molybdopterin converting factor small subunit